MGPGSSGCSTQAPRLSWRVLQVAAKALETGVFGAYFNVLINLKDITDQDFKEQVSQQRVDLAWYDSSAFWAPGFPAWALPSGSGPKLVLRGHGRGQGGPTCS